MEERRGRTRLLARCSSGGTRCGRSRTSSQSSQSSQSSKSSQSSQSSQLAANESASATGSSWTAWAWYSPTHAWYSLSPFTTRRSIDTDVDGGTMLTPVPPCTIVVVSVALSNLAATPCSRLFSWSSRRRGRRMTMRPGASDRVLAQVRLRAVAGVADDLVPGGGKRPCHRRLIPMAHRHTHR